MTLATEGIETRIDSAIDAATDRLLALQHPDGWWVGELESNATMIAQHLFWHHVLGLRTPELDRKIANELLARQRDDGTWSIWFEGPPDLSTSVEAYAALKLAGVDPGPKARDFIRSRGGIPRTRIFTKCFLALLGQWPWQRITPIPVELVLLPPEAPFSIYNFACWARGHLRPARRLPGAAARARLGRRPARDRRAPGAEQGAASALADEADRAQGGRALGARAPGGRRLLGRDPASVGLVDPHAGRARARLRGRDAQARGRGLGGLHDRRGRPAPPRGLPVARLGHGTGNAGAARLRPRARAPCPRPCGGLADRRGGHGPGRLVRAQARPRPGRLGVRVPERPLPRRGRQRRRRACAAPLPPRPRGGRARARLDGRDAVAQRRLGRLRRRQRGVLALQAAVLRLRQGHGRAERRRDRARARGARRGGRLRRRRAARASTGSSPSRSPTARGSAAGA